MKLFSKSLHFNASRSLQTSIVQLLRDRPMALAELQAATHVSPPTLRRDLRQLTRAGWVRRVGRTSSTGGRPATLYGLNGDTHLTIGAHLELPALNLALVSLDGQVLESVHLAGEDATSPELVVQKIASFAQSVRATHHPRRLLGIGVATPGFIDPASGQIISIGRTPGWSQFPLRDRLQAELNLPVVVENDIDCMTFAELAQNELPASADMLYLGVSEGVKASLVLGGDLYQGPYGNAGIVGRTITRDGDGGARYLEDTISVGRLCSAFDEATETAERSDGQWPPIAQLHDRGQKFQAILEAAAQNDPVCGPLVAQALEALAIATANLIYLLQPGLLIVGGALSNLPAGLRADFEGNVRRHLPTLLSNHLLITYASTTDTNVAAVGAAYRFLHHYPVEESSRQSIAQ